jgi:nitroreductase
MDVLQAVKQRRSIRKFKPDPIPEGHIEQMIDAARLAPSEANTQPLKYLAVTDPALLPRVFELLKWAAYLAPHGAPPEGRRPAAYVLILVDSRIKQAGYQRGLGAAAENLMLTALALGAASCWLGAVDAPAAADLFRLPPYLQVDSVVALGYADEIAVTEPLTDGVKYWRDEKEVHHVPKRGLSEVLFFNRVD